MLLRVCMVCSDRLPDARAVVHLFWKRLRFLGNHTELVFLEIEVCKESLAVYVISPISYFCQSWQQSHGETTVASDESGTCFCCRQSLEAEHRNWIRSWASTTYLGNPEACFPSTLASVDCCSGFSDQREQRSAAAASNVRAVTCRRCRHKRVSGDPNMSEIPAQ